MNTELLIKIVNNNLNYTNNTSFHKGDSGFDLYTPKEIVIKPNEVQIIDLGIQCEMLQQNVNISYYLYPRSSISKTPLMMANSVGIIDAGYRGNIKAAVRSFSNEDYIIQKNTRLFQICGPTLEPLKIQFIDKLSRTSRGNGGFGSTGV